LLARALIGRLATAQAQWAWKTLHRRPISARQPGVPYWPCTFCKKEKVDID
jgi:hypothetical protein